MPKFLTLLDIQKKNGTSKDVAMIDEIMMTAPEVTSVSSRTIAGTTAKTYIRTGVPRVGFRMPNAPADYVASTYEVRTLELFSMSTLVFVDDLILEASVDGPASVMSAETIGVAQGCALSLGSQMFYGKRIDKDGFPGLYEFIDDSMLMSANEAKKDTEEGTSVYAIVEGPRGVQWYYGNGSGMKLGPWADKELPRKLENGEIGSVPGKGAKLNSWVAIVNHSKLTAARLKNIGDAEGTTLDDDKIADLLMRFPSGIKPTKLIMNRKALNQLRKSRQIVAASVNGGSVGGGSITTAPIPTDAFGIPILVTDSILDNESDLSSIKGISHYGQKPQGKIK
ncbi:hypothetical protein QET93_011290 [Akkermansia sp. N21116]|uniref:major capsid protein n=1 Tax=Akkermansia sp. N21116 TaxID=3040764 RepID=UPI00244ED80C|nr:hypothetical protein [Akkermansia sp. N21116]WPX40116.1 hypothetical protein QET93_011290 [Akkermansia sp. N21116]